MKHSRWTSYQRYKDSQIHWLSEVPDLWDKIPLKYIAHLRSGDSINSYSIDETGAYPVYGGNGLRGYTSIGYTHDGIYPLIGRQGALCGNINYARGKFWASEHAVVVTPTKPINIHWLGELLRSMNLNQYSISAAQPGLSVETISNLRIPVPPRIEQEAIANFLERETIRIATLISKKQHQIELLQEKRSALISHVVTKGLNPNVKMKETGIEWLGEIPSGWDLKRLKYISPQISVGIVITPSKYYVESGIPCLRSLNVKEDLLTEDDLVYISPESNELLSKSMLHIGDLVAVRTGQPGTTAVINERYDGANCIDLIIIRKSSTYDSRFLCYVMNSEYSKAQYLSGTSGAIQAHFNIETASNMLIAVPPVEEQIFIREHLDKEVGAIKKLVEKIELSINVLQDYRTALISAAVTGKIDVRKEVA